MPKTEIYDSPKASTSKLHQINTHGTGTVTGGGTRAGIISQSVIGSGGGFLSPTNFGSFIPTNGSGSLILSPKY